jgi:hypothetical protein
MLKILGTAILAAALPLSVVAATAGWDATPNGAGWD